MRSGFSLVELSIVLVILGLLTGGILAGQSLIRASELRSVVTEFNKYQTAVMTFKDKYFSTPGDMSNAEDFWGTMTNCGAASPSGTGTQTCNGDGDGFLDVAGAPSQTGERFLFWQHLANAGIIEGTYDGIAGSGDVDDAELNINVPGSKVSNSGWYANSFSGPVPNTNNFDVNFGNSFTFGVDHLNGYTTEEALKPEEAWNIDKKLDDGEPASGKVIAQRWDDCTDAAANSDLDAQYLFSTSALECALRFKDVF